MERHRLRETDVPERDAESMWAFLEDDRGPRRAGWGGGRIGNDLLQEHHELIPVLDLCPRPNVDHESDGRLIIGNVTQEGLPPGAAYADLEGIPKHIEDVGFQEECMEFGAFFEGQARARFEATGRLRSRYVAFVEEYFEAGLAFVDDDPPIAHTKLSYAGLLGGARLKECERSAECVKDRGVNLWCDLPRGDQGSQ
jgi:hypothetical protein